jgi:hypothetical protein
LTLNKKYLNEDFYALFLTLLKVVLGQTYEIL